MLNIFSHLLNEMGRSRLLRKAFHTVVLQEDNFSVQILLSFVKTTQL